MQSIQWGYAVYNVNGNLFDENLNPVDMGDGFQVGQPTNFDDKFKLEFEQQDFSGLQLNNTSQTPVYAAPFDADAQSKQIEAMKAEMEKGGMPVKKQTNLEMLTNMLGSALISYAFSRLLGGNGNESAMIGLVGAGITHDEDNKMSQRWDAAKKMLDDGDVAYSPDAILAYVQNGDDKGMQAERQNNEADKRAGLNIDAANTRQQSQQQFTAGQNQQRYAQQNQMEQGREAFQSQQQAERLKAQADNQAARSSNWRMNTMANQIVAGDKPERDRYLQQYTGWLDAQKQMDIIKSATSVYNDPHASDEQKAEALARIQGAIPSLVSGIARGERGGNATLTTAQTKEALASIGLAGDKYNEATGLYNGTLSDAKINALSHQIEGNRSNISSTLNDIAADERRRINAGMQGDTVTAYGGRELPQDNNTDNSQPVAQAPSGSSDGDILYKNGQRFIVHNGMVYPD